MEDKTITCLWIAVKTEEPSRGEITDYCFDNDIKLISFVKQDHQKSKFNWYMKLEAPSSKLHMFVDFLSSLPEISGFFEELEEV